MSDQSLGHKEDRIKSMLSMVPYFGWIVGLVFLITEKSHVVRWYALQSVYFHLAMALIYILVLPIMRMTIVLIPLVVFSQGVVGLTFLVVCLAACLQIHSGKHLRIPIIADLVDTSLKHKS